jgi:hypothetical protein
MHGNKCMLRGRGGLLGGIVSIPWFIIIYYILFIINKFHEVGGLHKWI